MGTGTYMVPVSEPVLEKFGVGKKSRNRYRSNLVSGKSLGNRYQKNLVPEKVLEPVSEKFGSEKSTGFGIENI